MEGGRGRNTRGWKSENRSTKNCTPCRPRLNINYSPCSTANAGLFVESFVGKKRVTTSGIRLSGRARSFRDIEKNNKNGAESQPTGFVKRGERWRKIARTSTESKRYNYRLVNWICMIWKKNAFPLIARCSWINSIANEKIFVEAARSLPFYERRGFYYCLRLYYFYLSVSFFLSFFLRGWREEHRSERRLPTRFWRTVIAS